MTEGEIKSEILAFLNKLPDCRVRAQQKHATNRKSQTPVGWPDISGFFRDKALFIEVKKPGGSLSMAQHNFIVDAKSWGHLSFFAENLAQVRKELGV